MVRITNRIENTRDRAYDFVESIIAFGATKWKAILFFLGITLFSMFIVVFSMNFVIYNDGVEIGTIDDIRDFTPVITSAEETVSDITESDFFFTDISITPVIELRSKEYDLDIIKSTLVSSSNVVVSTYYLSVDGEPVFRAESRDDINNLIDSLTNAFWTDTNIVDVRFLESISLDYGTIPASITADYDTALDNLCSTLAPVISYEVVTEEVIPAKDVYISTTTMYEGYSKIIQYGSNGLSSTTYIEQIRDGQLISKETVSEKTIVRVKNTIYYQGSAELPDGYYNGVYLFPLQTYQFVSSPFGYRTGFGSSFHNGIDIAAQAWTDVYAVAAGEVIFSDYDENYGLNVIVQLDNGMIMYYSHLVESVVEVGDYIQQGQQLGYVGMTGLADGYHLHFEIRINDTPVDPAEYIPIP